jgi:hypothetical protein
METRSIWMGIHPRPSGTRILAQAGAGETLLKARLQTTPSHPRALTTLLEAVALWQGLPVRAALVVGDSVSTTAEPLVRDLFPDFGPNPLYQLDFVPRLQRPRVRDGLSGMGAFGDLRQLLIFEVAR